MTPDDPDFVRRLERLAAITPDAEATARALKRARTALMNAPVPHPLSQRRVLMFARMAAVVLFLAGGAALLGWFLVPRASAGLAFADVQEKVQSTRSVTFTVTHVKDGQATSKDRVLILAPGLLRTESAKGYISITDSDRRKSLLIDPAKKKATLILGLANLMPNLYDLMRNAAQDVIGNLPERTIDGKKTIGFRVRISAGDQKREASVWVDPQTKLPVRLEESGKEDGHEVGIVLGDIVFDSPLDAALFRLTAPEGYQFETAGLEKLPSPPTDAERLAPVVTPGVGIGPACFGMSKEEVIKALGEPDSIPAQGRGMSLLYFSRGFQVDVSPRRGLMIIHCVTQKTFLTQVRDFQGKTKEGIVMGASEKAIMQAYGKPAERETNGPETVYLRYPKLGLDFTLFSDKLVQFMLQPQPAQGKP